VIVLPDHSSSYAFPPAHFANEDGLLAVGGDLKPERLIQAYRHGIFPWYNEGQPILWWSPDPRTILRTDALKVSSSLSKRLRNAGFTVSADTSFADVMRACAGPRRQFPDGGTWITEEMFSAYCRLHDSGYAHSIETWLDGELAGGLYGVCLGNTFFGESMFSRVGDASKVALVTLVRALSKWQVVLIDCQQPSPHLFSMGAVEIPRVQFMLEIERSREADDRAGNWHLRSMSSESTDFIPARDDIEIEVVKVASFNG